MSRIVVLNGVGSVGKTTLARAIQRAAPVPFLHVQMDAFLEMLPVALDDDPQSFSYCPGPHGVEIHAGPVGARLIRGMHAAVAALAASGNDLILDTVMEKDGTEDLHQALGPAPWFFVGLHAPLSVIEERERARGDRMIGLARAQFARVHVAQRYDLELDLSDVTPETAAKRVLRAMGL